MRVRWSPSEHCPHGLMVVHAESPAEYAILRGWGGHDQKQWRFHLHSYGGTCDPNDSANGMSICIGFVDRERWEKKPEAPRDPLIFGASV